tara:strand:+ start:1247 stop:1432 length:186 start_codon:yes stop_codon:yes gene_type:complete
MVKQIEDLHDERMRQLDKQLLDIEYDTELQRDIIEKQRQKIKEHIRRKEILQKRAKFRVVK